MANCPKCESPVGKMLLEPGPLGDKFAGPFISGFIVVCPKCRSAVGVLPDASEIAVARLTNMP